MGGGAATSDRAVAGCQGTGVGADGGHAAPESSRGSGAGTRVALGTRGCPQRGHVALAGSGIARPQVGQVMG